MKNISKKEKVLLGVVVALVFSIGLLRYKTARKEDLLREEAKKSEKYEKSDQLQEPGELLDQEEDLETEDLQLEDQEEEILVHICGQVVNPGLVQLDRGENRLSDAIEKAGGITAEADIDYINLARKLEDEEKVYIRALGEELDPDLARDLDLNPAEKDLDEKSAKLEINTCSKAELMTLSGIGDVTADKIIKHREGSKFQEIEDLMDVSGIGEKKFEAIKDDIVVK